MAAEYFTFYQISDIDARTRTTQTRLYNGEAVNLRGTFELANFERTSVEVGSKAVKNEITINFPLDNVFANDRFINRFEERYWVEIKRTHDGNVFWVGRLENVKVSGAGIALRFLSRLGSIGVAGLPQDFQYNCRHALFDGGCRVSRRESGPDQNEWTVNITKVNNFANQIEVSSTAAVHRNFLPSLRFGYFRQGGLIYRITSMLGRTVFNLNGTQGFTVGLATLVAGCDKKMDTCRRVFDNLRNFGGFPYKPQTVLWGESLITQSNQLNKYNL